LAINGFAWLENGKESEWIKMKQHGSPIAIKQGISENANQDLRDYGFS
jgi:hypothetical protein